MFSTTIARRVVTVMRIAKIYTNKYSIDDIEKMIDSGRYNDDTIIFLEKVLLYKIDKYEWSIINPPESPPSKKAKVETKVETKVESSAFLDPDNCPEGYRVVVEVQKCGGKGQTHIVRHVEKKYDE